MITKLADKWRTDGSQAEEILDGMREAKYEDEQRFMDNARIRVHQTTECANELEEALPKWTRINEDESTWPEPADVVMLCTGFDSANKPYLSVRMIGADAIACYKSLIWRPLCDIDYPPEQES